MTYDIVPDAQWFRSANGEGVLAGSPLSFFKVSPAGALVLDAIQNGTSLPAHHAQLTDRLLRTGAAHPVPHQQMPASDITVVIPAFVTDTSQLSKLQSLVNSLNGLTVIVVDDCSPLVPQIHGATIIRHRSNLGPGAARNTGLERVTTPCVAFVDDDTEVSTQQILQLGAYLSDEHTAMAAPRVRTLDAKTSISEYESHHSPLDLGSRSAVVRPLSRVSYVPAAVMVARTSAIRNIGGFLSTLRLGEDVDLVWRLAQSGEIIRYVPDIECAHRPRASVRKLLRQRFGYGTSAANLDALHRRTASPLRTHWLFLIFSFLLLSGFVYAAALIFPFIAVYFILALQNTSLSLRQRARVIFIGAVASVRLTASAVLRAWWPIFFALGAYFVRPGFTLAVCVFVPVIVGLIRHKPHHPIMYSVLRIIDPVAYGAGVWVGAFRRKSFGCLLPVITVRRSSAR